MDFGTGLLDTDWTIGLWTLLFGGLIGTVDGGRVCWIARGGRSGR